MKYYKKKNKFGAVKQTYGNYSYDSKLEAQWAADLDLLVSAKELKSWDRQHKWDLYVQGKKICRYTIDFRTVTVDGIVQYIEVKGAQDYAFQIRWKLVQALFDELTEGEHAELYLNEKLVMTSLK